MLGEYQNTIKLDFLLDITIEEIDESWRKIWGQSIKSKPLRHAIENTPRLSQKLITQILQHAQKHIKASTNQVSELSEEHSILIKRFTNKEPALMIRRVGLIILGKNIKTLFSSTQVHSLLQHLTKEEIRYAIEQHDSSIDTSTILLKNITNEVDKIGLTSFLIWLQQFPKNIAIHLAIRLPRLQKDSAQVSKHIAIKAVEHVLKETD